MSEKYYVDRKDKIVLKLRELQAELPYFCSEFFLGIENQTTPLTRLNYAYDLRIFFDFLTTEIDKFAGKKVKQMSLMDLNNVTPSDIELFLNYLNYYKFKGKIYRNNEQAKARKLCTIRSFFKYFFKKEKLNSNVTVKVDLPKIHEKNIIRLENNEMTDLLDQVETGFALTPTQQAFHRHTSLRDYAIVNLFLGTGIRISELIGLDIDDIDFSNNAFKITRKGGNQSILYFNDDVAEILKEYMEFRKNQKGVKETEKALFLSLQKKRICPRAVQNLVKKYSQIATPLKHITPHKLRSTYGTNLYKETKDIYVVADVLGHKDVNTTKKHYAAMSDDIRKEASTKIKLRK